MSQTSSILLRFTFCLLFLWFGFQQLMSPEVWTGFLPEWVGYLPIPGEMFVQLNGWFEIIFALALAVGLHTRIVAGMLGLHLLGIAISTGGAIGVRDAALGLATLSLAFSEPDVWTFDRKVKLGS